MRILLMGEYSNVHNTLAIGLRALGHEVTVASDGDSWKIILATLTCTVTLKAGPGSYHSCGGL